MSDSQFRLAAFILLTIQMSVLVASIVFDMIRSKRFYDRLEADRKKFEQELEEIK